MNPDFNHELASYLISSPCLARLKKEAADEEGDRKSSALFQDMAQLTFESVAIFNELAPNQTYLILRGSPREQLHAFHSPAARAFANRKLSRHEEAIYPRAKAICSLITTRPGFLSALKEEISQQRKLWAATQEAEQISEATELREKGKPRAKRESL